MSKCTESGCRNLELKCKDCERVVVTYGRNELEPNDWNDLDTFPPALNEPIEYTIIVTCKGWYKGDGTKHVIAPDEREAPVSRLASWRPLKDGQNWEEGRKAVLEYREKMVQQE